ncbi:hypothetical protein [Ectothiorhodospira variabilis]|uniref:hypothetical protein n=1 Tax=Ectothiorhodospira variabilis TaxID=505694 RepID=UPI001EFB516B|nr:hypothetical protein [Ectothiorhodospira variabilis]MCG5499141.1 hypothetical protein [Ectothiorhodospira variabilis]
MGGYFGSKATVGLYQAIIALMPPHDTYIETHLGGGAIMQRKPAALRNIGIDLDPQALQEFAGPYPVEKVNACVGRGIVSFVSELIGGLDEPVRAVGWWRWEHYTFVPTLC